MFGLLWLATAVLGSSSDLAAWKVLLGRIDGSLPLTTAANSKICYYFDVSQTCSAAAVAALLSQAAPNSTPWVLTSAQCDSLLSEQRVYAEAVASSIFSAAITSAATASVTDFELLVQSWVLRVGYHSLTVDHAAFVAVLKDISDWTTVQCEGANFLYDGMTITKPNFLGTVDCDVLGTVYVSPECRDFYCGFPQAATCCMASRNSRCCVGQYDGLYSDVCINNGCEFQTFCCHFRSDSPCCTGNS